MANTFDTEIRREAKTERRQYKFRPTLARLIETMTLRAGVSETEFVEAALEKETRKIPLYGVIPCGPLSDTAQDTIEGYYNVGDFYQVRDGDFLLRAKGDSMTGAGVQDNDLVLIRPSSTCESGEVAAVLIDSPMGTRATLKKVQYSSDSPIVKLIPMNPEHPIIEVDTTKETLRICGVKRGVVQMH